MRTVRVLIGFVLLYQIACAQKPASLVISDEKIITIAVSGNKETGFRIEQPVPGECIIPVNFRPRWIILNNTTSDVVRLLKIYDFQEVTSDHSQGKTGICKSVPSEFKFENISAGQQQSPQTQCYVKAPTPGTAESYKYRVSVELASGSPITPLDPMIVITR